MPERRLVLVRHTKAEADGEVDAERPLAQRGRRDAAAVGRWIAEQGIDPDRVLVSPALRARQTWAAAASDGGLPVDPDLDARIYRNTVDDLLDAVRDCPDGVATLVLVGHNPSVQELADELDDGTGDPDARAALGRDYPTGGVAVFAVPGSWGQLALRTAILQGFAVPRG